MKKEDDFKKEDFIRLSVPGGPGRQVFVDKGYVDVFQRVFKEYRTDYNMMGLFRSIYLLNSDPIRGKNLNYSGTVRTIEHGNIHMAYMLCQGVVIIFEIGISRTPGHSTTGLYKVNRDFENWTTEDTQVFSIENSDSWKNKANYAAVAGRYKDKNVAGRELFKHIVGAYMKKDNSLSEGQIGEAYSMFYIKKGHHKDPASAQALASIIQQADKNQVPVNWVVHHNGADTFENAAKLLSISNATAGLKLKSRQNVFFTNSTIVNVKTLKKLCSDAGMNYIGYHDNHRDLLRGRKARNNFFMPIIKTIVLSGAALNLTGVIGMGKVRPLTEKVLNSAASGEIFSTLLTGGALLWVVYDSVKQCKPLSVTLRCTFGRGNEKWYDDDDSF